MRYTAGRKCFCHPIYAVGHYSAWKGAGICNILRQSPLLWCMRTVQSQCELRVLSAPVGALLGRGVCAEIDVVGGCCRRGERGRLEEMTDRAVHAEPLHFSLFFRCRLHDTVNRKSERA